MNNLTHVQARQYLDTQVDGVLSVAQKDWLDAHLAQCASCQDYARWLDSYEGWLKTSLQSGAPARPLSSAQELYHVRRTIEEKVRPMKFLKLFNTAARWLAAAAMFVVLPVLFVLLLQTRPSSMMGDQNGIPPGLLIVTGNHQAGTRSLWVQGQSGELDLLIESDYEADFELSPDRTQVLYTARGDIWLFDLATRQSQNVTQTPDFVEWRPEWRPAGLVYVSTPSEQMGELTSATPPAALPHGLLTWLTFGGMPETLVSEPVAPLRIAPSPDGQAVVYITFNGVTNDLWLYRVGMDVEEIDLSGYQGQPWAVDVNWSPDGQQLLLALAGQAYQQDNSTHGAVALLNVESGDFRTLFIYNPVIQLSWTAKGAAPAWSPDGAWLIFPVHSSDSPQSGLRVIKRTRMNESSHINFAGVHAFDHDALSNPERKNILPTPVISPDSQWAAMAVYEDVLLLRTADWQPIALGLEGNEQNFGILDVLGWGLLEPDLEPSSPTPTHDGPTLAPSFEVMPETPAPTATIPSAPTALPAPSFTGDIDDIRSVADIPELPLEFIEMTTMINSPDGSLPVALYQDSQGRKFFVEPLSARVVEIDARALLTSGTLGPAELSQAELKAKAEKLVEASGADLASLYSEFRFEEGVKAMHFFDWRHKGSPEWFNPPFVQVGLHVSGELIAYYNTLGFE